MTEKEAKETPSEAADVTLEVAVLSLPYYPPPYYKGKIILRKVLFIIISDFSNHMGI